MFIDFVMNIIDLIAYLNQIDPIGLGPKGDNEVQLEGRDSRYESSSQKANNVLDNSSGETVHVEGDERVKAKAQRDSLSIEGLCNLRIEDSYSKTGEDEDVCSFTRFDTAKDPLDHYFLGANGQVHDLYILAFKINLLCCLKL